MRGLAILEGPDACGKTTLAEKMVELWGGKYIHLTYVKGRKAVFEVQLRALMDAAAELEKGRFVVIDRHWVSENIYADVYRGGSELAAEARIMDRIIMSMGGVYVLCCPENPMDAVRWHREMHKTGRELYKPSEEIKHIAEYYRWLWTGLPKSFGKMGKGCASYAAQLVDRGGTRRRVQSTSGTETWFNFDRNFWSKSTIEDFLKDYMVPRVRAAQRIRSGPYNGNFCGNLEKANVLFVGNSLGKGMPGCNWPFHWLSGSSKVMADVLHEIGFDESRGAWTNVNAGISPHLNDVLILKTFPQIICLGEIAAQVMRTGDFPNSKIYNLAHPAYAKRFACKGAMTQFKRELKEILK